MLNLYYKSLNILYEIQKKKYFKNDSEKKLDKIKKALIKLKITEEKINKLNIIHITGSKGKGTTCMFIEKILRCQNYSTGLFISPHLTTIRERIQINGKMVSKETFATNFWQIKKKIKLSKFNFFEIMTILMFKIFCQSDLDVVIIEAGIGGLYDSTNIITAPICVGITNIHLEHTNILGNTLEEIAIQKSGIFKKNSLSFINFQSYDLYKIFKKKSIEIKNKLFITNSDNFELIDLNFLDKEKKKNLLFALCISINWIKEIKKIKNESFIFSNIIDLNIKIPGRCDKFVFDDITYYLDGAHTNESIINCINWFENNTNSKYDKYLIFNMSNNRPAGIILKLLKKINFKKIYFIPSIAGTNTEITNINTVTYEKLKIYKQIWNNNNIVEIYNNFLEVATELSYINKNIQVLVTGSLHLIGAALNILNPNLISY